MVENYDDLASRRFITTRSSQEFACIFFKGSGWDTVMEKLLEQVSFEAGNQSKMQMTIDQAYVRERLGELAADEDLSRYVL